MKKEGILEYIGVGIFVALASLVAAGVISKNTGAPEGIALAVVDDHSGPAQPEHKEPEKTPEPHGHKEPAKPDPKPEPAVVKAPEPKEPAKPEPAVVKALANYELNEDAFELNVTGYGPFGEQTIDFFDCTGELKMVPGNPETSTFNGEIIMELMDNKHAKLLKSLSAKEFFDVKGHPEAYFSSSSVKKTAGGYEITGALEIKGIRKKIKYPATITETDDDLRIEAEFRVLKSWWDLVYSATLLEIKDEALIRLDLTFSK